MRFEAFISRCRRQWPEFDDPRRLARSRNPADRRLARVLDQVPGMATENKLMLLNCAVAELAENEVYCEVGCYKGASIIGAATGNPDARIVACDNFSQFDGAADALRKTLDGHTSPRQVEFFDMDFRDLMGAAPWRPSRVGAYFYDGGHSFRDQYEGVALAIPHLSDDALVIIDDTNKREARAANGILARSIPGFELILNLRTPRNHSPTWWNGVQVYRYRRRDGERDTTVPGIGFAIRKFIYDDILLAMKHRRRARRQQRKDRRRSDA
jgi:protein O-GlcNAc transferase